MLRRNIVTGESKAIRPTVQNVVNATGGESYRFRDRIFNRGALSIGPGPLCRGPRCAGDGAPATASVCLVAVRPALRAGAPEAARDDGHAAV